MSIQVERLIVCGKCGFSGVDYIAWMFRSNRELRKYAIKDGWSYKNLNDYCPACTEQELNNETNSKIAD